MNSMQIISSDEAEALVYLTKGPFDKNDFKLHARQAQIIALFKREQVIQLKHEFPEAITQHKGHIISHPSILIIHDTRVLFMPCLRFDKFEDQVGNIHNVPMTMAFFQSKDTALRIRLAYG